jgi:hypothetical protein
MNSSIRRHLTNAVVVIVRRFNERHLRQLLRQYVAYYRHDRTHLAFAKETPAGRRPWRRATPTLPSWPYLESADCIIATTFRREPPHRLATELVQLRERDERMIDKVSWPGVGKTRRGRYPRLRRPEP